MGSNKARSDNQQISAKLTSSGTGGGAGGTAAGGRADATNVRWSRLAPLRVAGLSHVTSADRIWSVVNGLALMGALWLVGLRQGRCYLLCLASYPVVDSLIVGQLSGLIALSVAVAWRFRERAVVAGVAAAVAIVLKLLAWPLLVWLLVTRRFKAAEHAQRVRGGRQRRQNRCRPADQPNEGIGEIQADRSHALAYVHRRSPSHGMTANDSQSGMARRDAATEDWLTAPSCP